MKNSMVNLVHSDAGGVAFSQSIYPPKYGSLISLLPLTTGNFVGLRSPMVLIHIVGTVSKSTFKLKYIILIHRYLDPLACSVLSAKL